MYIFLSSVYRQALGHSLTERSRILEGEATAHQRVTPAHPRPGRRSRSPVAFVYQHEVVALESLDGDRLVAHLVAELVDVDDFDGAARGRLGLVEVLCETEARQVQLFQVLARQTFVGRQQDDLVRVVLALTSLEITQVLLDVDVQQQRLAAAGGIPEGDLVQIVGVEVLEGLGTGFCPVANHLGVQAVQQVLPMVEVPVQVDLGEQQREVLEVLHVQLMPLQLVALGGDALPMGDDVQVIAAQVGFADAVHVEQVACQLVEELGLPILVDAFKAVFSQPLLECSEAAPLEKPQHPAVEHQLLVEVAFLGGRSAG